MDLIEKIKSIEKYVCEYFEDLDLDDPVEEGCFAEYEEVRGATDKEIHDFENHFNIVLPKDLKEIYTYKNGSRFSPFYRHSLIIVTIHLPFYPWKKLNT